MLTHCSRVSGWREENEFGFLLGREVRYQLSQSLLIARACGSIKFIPNSLHMVEEDHEFHSRLRLLSFDFPKETGQRAVHTPARGRPVKEGANTSQRSLTTELPCERLPPAGNTLTMATARTRDWR